jgi:hypothetical protein
MFFKIVLCIVDSVLVLVGQLGEELQRDLPPGKAHVCKKSGDLINVLFHQLVEAVQRKSHL